MQQDTPRSFFLRWKEFLTELVHSSIVPILPDGIEVDRPVEIVASGVGIVAAEIAALTCNLFHIGRRIRLAVGSEVLDPVRSEITKYIRISNEVIVVKQHQIKICQEIKAVWQRARELISIQQQMIQTTHKSKFGRNVAGQFILTKIQQLQIAQSGNPRGDGSGELAVLHGQFSKERQFLNEAWQSVIAEFVLTGEQVSQLGQITQFGRVGQDEPILGQVQVLQVRNPIDRWRNRSNQHIAIYGHKLESGIVLLDCRNGTLNEVFAQVQDDQGFGRENSIGQLGVGDIIGTQVQFFQ